MDRSAFLYDLVEGGRRGIWIGKWFDRLTIFCIAAGVLAGIAFSVPQFQIAGLLSLLLGMAAFFVIEYGMRLIACVRAPQAFGLSPAYTRLRYATSPLGIIDLAPLFILGIALTGAFASAANLSVLYLLKLPRYFEGSNLVATVIRNERKSLLLIGVYGLILLVGSATIMFVLEHDVQPQTFGSIPEAMWWSVVTIATVGYGDVVPVSQIGRVAAALTMICSIVLFGFVFGTIGLGLSEEMRRRNFIVTWALVARVPSFRRLSALQIAQISALLEPIAMRRGDAVVTRGEVADSLYFIFRGDLRTAGEDGRLLSEGDHFGNEALAPNARRAASVIAQTDCQLLRMKVDDLRKLMSRTNDLAEAIRSGVTNAEESA